MEVAQLIKRLGKAVARRKSHWILDSPLARRSLKGTVDRDTVRGSLWRPATKENIRTMTSRTITRWGTKLAKLRKIVI